MYEALFSSVVEGRERETVRLVTEALDAGADPSDIIHRGLVPAIEHVGDLFAKHIYFIPEMICSAAAMERGLALAKARMTDAPAASLGKFIIGTVRGDCHDIGKSLTGAMLRAAGFEVLDLGCDVSPEAFADALAESGAKFLGMSALLTTTMFAMGDTIALLEKRGLRAGVTVIVGGAVINEAFARRIGADHYAPLAMDTVLLAKSRC